MGWVNYDVWKGRTKGTKPGQIDFYRTGEGPYQGSTSGMQKIRRVPNIKNVISPAQFKGKYIDCGTREGFINSSLTISKYL